MPTKGGHNTPQQLQQNRNWHKEWHAVFHPHVGEKNPMYGRKNPSYRKGLMQITNGIRTIWISKEDEIPEGWYRGNSCNDKKIREAYINGSNTETD